MSTDRLGHLLAALPPNARRLLQAMPASGALAAAYKKHYPASVFQHVGGAPLAQSQADLHTPVDLDSAPDDFFAPLAMADCWIFDETLETLADPQGLLARIKRHLPLDACVVACVANPACWSGAGRGIAPPQLARMFIQAGLRIVRGIALVGAQPDAARMQALREQAAASPEPEQAVRDALSSHTLIVARPAP